MSVHRVHGFMSSTPNTDARLNTITLTRYISATVALINDAIADVELQELGKQLVLAEFARK